ncbi:type VI secretion system baseplate subunit TssG [Geomonas sp. RF6]|uniref:type VI secretion system baseplate subunit TssG n=1 Tax=Geomonas sp. RF6 TaxID=2897342 RepID=UPI001E3F0020|nr:type VI secretion system baseplate subunit TssG [Geomonas sp. RF6]UFS70713.1 type VI secretion system baseplate subunit TssG [Geomonas sp. RF6]
MASQERAPHASVRDRLFGEFYRFSFYSAVRLLESLAPEKGGVGECGDLAREPVRLGVKPGFSFPPSDICALTTEKGVTRLEVAFLGLVGPSGVLPHWYNELATERSTQKDKEKAPLPAFFDLFHHRLLSLFFLAWKKYRCEISYRPDATDRFSFYLRSLMGLGTSGVSGKLGLPDESPMYYSGILSRRVPTAAAVSAAVRYYFGVPVELDQFVGRLITLGPEDRTAVGRANSRLGVDTVCGSQVWESHTKFRLKLGPMPFRSYARFLPGGDRLGPLFSLVKYQVGIEYEFEVRIILKREDVPPCRLGDTGAQAPRLGWSTWLKAPAVPLGADPHATFQEMDAQR